MINKFITLSIMLAKLGKWSIAGLISFLITYFTEITLHYLEQYVVVISLIFTDGIFGLIAGVKREGFRTHRAIKILQTAVAWIGFLTILLTVEKAFPQMYWISETILLPWIVFEIVSIVKNMAGCGYIKWETLLVILSKIDTHKHEPLPPKKRRGRPRKNK